MLLLAFIVCITLISCRNVWEKSAFFIWQDGYLAMDQDEEYQIGLTLYSDSFRKLFQIKDIIGVSLNGTDKIQISGFNITNMDKNASGKYRGYSVQLTVRAMETGIFHSDGVVFLTSEGSIHLPVGDWVFDVSKSKDMDLFNELIDISSSPAAGGNAKTFVYDYKIRKPEMEISQIQIGESTIISSSDGMPASNSIELPDTMKAPMKFFRPKVFLTSGEEIVQGYGMSYYAGALSLDEDGVVASKEKNRTIIQ